MTLSQDKPTMAGPPFGDHTSREQNAERPPEIRPITLANARISLDPVTPKYYEFLYSLAIEGESSFRWLTAGGIPPIEKFVSGLWDGVLTQFVVRDKSSHRPCGHVISYNADLHSGHAGIAVAASLEARTTGAVPEAAIIFMNYCFTVYNLRKLYLEVPEYNHPQFASGLGKFCREEGRLREHLYYDGRYWDRYVYAVYRDDFMAIISTLSRFTGTGPSEGPADER
jgi:RimJ/RimL family protein N-acetyltransferase